MKSNIKKRLGTGLTALTLTCTLGLNSCTPVNDRYSFSTQKDGSFVAADNSFIDNNSIDNIYVIETQNGISQENQIYITIKTKVKYNNAHKQDYISYINIFNNIEIYNTRNEETKHNLEILEETPLFDYLLAYDLVKSRYYYDDMLAIYEKIKEEYKLKNDKSISKKLIIEDNRL